MACENLVNELAVVFSGAAKRAFAIDEVMEITRSTKEAFGHYQCNSALKIAKRLGQSPRDVALKIIENLEKGELIEKTEIAGPGFINIYLSLEVLSNQLHTIYADEKLGVPRPKKLERVICEFSSPNIAKEMHVGHLRSTIIGDSLARLLEFFGHDVIRLNHVGDWGTQFGMLIAYLKKYHPEVIEDASKADLSELMEWYRASKKEFDELPLFKKTAQEEVVKLQGGDEISRKAWQKICEISRKGFKEIYDILGVHLNERGESFYNPYLAGVIEDFQKKGLLEIDNGAKCVFLEGYTNKEGDPLPLIIQKGDGGYNYATTDLAGFKYRVSKDLAERIIVVTDNGQANHFHMVYDAAKKVGYIDPAKVRFDHVGFGVVLAPDGKKFKSRESKTEKLSDLLEEAVIEAKVLLKEREVEDIDKAARILGIGSVKYADLSCNRVKDYVFSYERMLKFEGNTAAFILYAYVRIQSIKRKIGLDLDSLYKTTKITLTHPSEIALALHLRQFGETLGLVAEDLLPSHLTDYLYHLAEKFHAFFRDCRVEGVPEQNSRLLLIEIAAKILKQGLLILGIETLSKM